MALRFSVLTGLIFAFGVSVQGCQVLPPTIQELNVVATKRDEAFPFSQAQTYVLPDQVQVIQDLSNLPLPSPTPSPSASASPFPVSPSTPLPQTLNDAIIQTITQNLDSRGYQRLTDPSGPKPSIFVQVSAFSTSHTSAYYSYWYPYWGASYGAWYGGFGYGWSPTTDVYVTESTSGALIIDVTNPNAPNNAYSKIPSVWVAALNGLIDGSSTSDIQTRAVQGINQAFTQSPYFTRLGP